VIATTGAKRAKEFPDVPTVAESGFKDFVAASWFGIVVPAGTPPPIVQKLTNEITKVLADPAVKERLGGDVQLGPKAFATVIKADAEKWGKLVKEAGNKPEKDDHPQKRSANEDASATEPRFPCRNVVPADRGNWLLRGAFLSVRQPGENGAWVLSPGPQRHSDRLRPRPPRSRPQVGRARAGDMGLVPARDAHGIARRVRFPHRARGAH